MKKIIAIITVLLALMLGLNKSVERDHQQILKLQGAKWTDFYQAGDLDGLMTLYTDDAMVALHGQPALFGKEAIRDFFTTRMGRTEATFELEYEVIETHGKIAYIVSKYWLVAKNISSGELYQDAGRSLLVYKRVGGSWKIAADIDQFSPDIKWPSPSGIQ